MAGGFEFFLQILMRLLAFLQSILPGEWPSSYPLNDGDKFDFIVVGAGSAGAIVASRLSEHPEWNVLLVEAGGDPPLASVVPSLFFTLLGTESDWNYRGYFEKGTGCVHRDCLGRVPQGKCLGGSSSINFEIYSRGVPADYDEWGNVAPGWSWENCLPYFKKSEGMTDPEILHNPDHAELHSADGPVLVSRPKGTKDIQEKEELLLNAFEEIGVKRIPEINGPDPYGATKVHYTLDNGRRSSTAEAFLKSTVIKPNLYIAKNTRVIKVLIDTKTKTANGVTVVSESGKTKSISAEKEVIVSAGTINSPVLLKKSGIGPKEELNKFKIPVIADLPVGKNMSDHIAVPVIIKGLKGTNNRLQDYLSMEELAGHPFASIGGYFNIQNISTPKPQIQFFVIHSDANNSAVFPICKNMLFNDELCQSVHDVNLRHEIELVLPTLLHPSDSGEIKLRSNRPFDDPVIDFGFFTNENDISVLVKAIKYIAKLGNTTYFKKDGGGIANIKLTACNEMEFGSDEYWSCYVKAGVMPFMHSTGTCAMGKHGVVDENLKVHGVKGLRVVDASVMPSVPSGNTNAPAMMVGERAADLIKADYFIKQITDCN